MKRIIAIVILIMVGSCKSGSHGKCDAYGSIEKKDNDDVAVIK